MELRGITHTDNCYLDKETSKTLNSLVLFNTSLLFYEEYIIFPHLISLEILEINLDNVFERVKFDSNSFPKLQKFKIGVSSLIDYIILNDLLNVLKNLKELTIINNSYDYLDGDYEYGTYFEQYYTQNIPVIPSEEIYEEELNKKSEQLGNIIVNMEYLESLKIYHFNDDNPFINIILEKYNNTNLKEFKSNCINLSSAQTFVNNNKNIKYIELNN